MADRAAFCIGLRRCAVFPSYAAWWKLRSNCSLLDLLATRVCLTNQPSVAQSAR